jgi:hypothetical protein
MSVTVMRAVAVLERPYMGLPSMSVAWMISVYCGTFWKGFNGKWTSGSGETQLSPVL